MRITLAQVDSDLGDIVANLCRAEKAVDAAMDEGSELIVFPELHLTGYCIGRIDADLSMHADDERLSQLATRATTSSALLPELLPSCGIGVRPGCCPVG